MDSFNMNKDIEQLKKQLDRIENKLERLDKKLDEHIDRIWNVYKTMKNPIQSVTKFFKR